MKIIVERFLKTLDSVTINVIKFLCFSIRGTSILNIFIRPRSGQQTISFQPIRNNSMAILTLLLATTRGCRWLETCQKFVNHNSKCRILLGMTSRVPISAKAFSSQLKERLAAAANSTPQAGDSPRLSRVIPNGNLSPLETNNEVQVALWLQKVLDCNVEEAIRLVRSYEGFTMIDPTDLTLNYEKSVEAGFALAVIKENPGILSFPTDMLMKKIKFIKTMEITDINDAVSFMCLGLTKLRVFTQKLKQDSLENGGINRIQYLSEQLAGRTLDVCNVMARHYFMQKITYSKLVLNLKIMLDHHVSKEDILNDVWGFRYRPEVITERLKRVVDAGVSPVKPWMIRCPEEILSRRILKETLRYSVLGDNRTTIEYLSERIGYDKNCLEDILVRNPDLKHISGPKMKRVIDFLMENGYPSEQLIRAPRVLLRKVETMQERLDELTKLGHRPRTVRVFCMTQREYDEHLSRVKQWRMEKNITNGT